MQMRLMFACKCQMVREQRTMQMQMQNVKWLIEQLHLRRSLFVDHLTSAFRLGNTIPPCDPSALADGPPGRCIRQKTNGIITERSDVDP
jgi:hypothetical protein